MRAMGRAPPRWPLLLLAAVLLLGSGAEGVKLKPKSANTFTNDTIVFMSDTPVRWKVVPRQGRPNFEIVMASQFQITIRAGQIGGQVLVVAEVLTCTTRDCMQQLNSTDCELVEAGVQRVAALASECGAAYANADWHIEPRWKALMTVLLVTSIIALFALAVAGRRWVHASADLMGEPVVTFDDPTGGRIVMDIGQGSSSGDAEGGSSGGSLRATVSAAEQSYDRPAVSASTPAVRAMQRMGYGV